MDEQTSEIIAILKALDEDWAIVDEYPNEDYLVLVNESRMVMEGFFPRKALVQIMEDQGLIKDSEKKRRSKPGQIPYVYFYKLTDKGRALLHGD